MSEADGKNWIDSTKVSESERRKRDEQMMKAVLHQEREGWTRISSTCLQYVRPTGCGFVTLVRKEWKWLADRNGEPRKQGTRTLLESAMLDVTQIIN